MKIPKLFSLFLNLKCQDNNKGEGCKNKATHTVCELTGWYCDKHYKLWQEMVNAELIKKGEIEK